MNDDKKLKCDLFCGSLRPRIWTKSKVCRAVVKKATLITALLNPIFTSLLEKTKSGMMETSVNRLMGCMLGKVEFIIAVDSANWTY